MPTAPTYPGVYVEEIPSGVRTIAGVATSITAFVGRAASGPTDRDPESPVIINSYDDFEREFGMLDPAYPMAYAVRDFYLNGGAQAAIVRLYKEEGGKPAKATIKIPNLPLEAASAGSPGNQLRVCIDAKVSAEAAQSCGLANTDLFNLTVRDMASGNQESFTNLSVKESPRRADHVLKAGSSMLRVAASLSLPAAAVPPAHLDADPGNTVWEQEKSSTGVASADQAADSAALDDTDYLGDSDAETGIYALKKTDLFNLLCLPPDLREGDTSATVYQNAMAFCLDRRAFLIVDAPAEWGTAGPITQSKSAALDMLGQNGDAAQNAAMYFPRVIESDPKRQGQIDIFVACGIVAGVMARTDAQRGVWRAPAGIDAALKGIQGLAVTLNDAQNGTLNQLGVNCLRSFPQAGPVIWGSRTLRRADVCADEYKYVPVRRLALYIEESLYRGIRWVAFEPNDESLWAQIRLNVGTFMHNLFGQGAFQGATWREAYLVKCDRETTTQNEINLGIVNIVVGFAPIKPSEFVVIQLQQLVGQIQS